MEASQDRCVRQASFYYELLPVVLPLGSFEFKPFWSEFWFVFCWKIVSFYYQILKLGQYLSEFEFFSVIYENVFDTFTFFLDAGQKCRTKSRKDLKTD